MKNVKNNKGITLMALVITIILLIILASIGTYSGIQVVKSAQFTAFSTELKIMQTQVNKLYEEKKNGNSDVNALGKTISSSSTTVQSNATKAFNASGIRDTSDYKYFDTDTIKSLNIEGVEGEFLVNIDKRSVISYDGFEYEGKKFYTIKQLENNGLYNVEYINNNDEKPTFNTIIKKSGENKWKISVTDVKYNGNIAKWDIFYKRDDESNWSVSRNSNVCEVDKEGKYSIKIANNDIISDAKSLVVNIYENQGLILYLDGINNTRSGHDANSMVWEDLSGNNNDFIKLENANDILWSENSYVGDRTNRTMYLNKAILENAQGCTVEICYDIPEFPPLSPNGNQNHYFIFHNRQKNIPANGFQFIVATVTESGVDGRNVYASTFNAYRLSDTLLKACKDKKRRTFAFSTDNDNIIFSVNDNFGYLEAQNDIMSDLKQRDCYSIGSAYSWATGNDHTFKGNIYSIRIYNRNLTEEELRSNYQIDKKRFNIIED